MESLDELERQEKILANRLRAVCTPYGDERESLLHESADILFSMGRLYTKKAEITHGMEQKLNFIKSATLLHGARVRFEIFLSDRKRSYAVLCAAKEMGESLFNACNGKSCDLMKLSNNIKRRFKALREIEKREVTKLEIITDDMSSQEMERKRSKKIKIVRCLLQKNTKNFKALMQHIAAKCIEILGHPPCEFTVAGMGSLAREEITLFSDFEHAIILDEGVQDLPSYESIKEYFRWFAVLFQVIIIGLGETIIPSVGVKSINDAYSSNKSKNWFYDAYTPSAVAIDGMMPHACKNPLGRSEITEKKKHTVELIQPVSKMAMFVTKAEELRNGYHLQEMLRQCCFVYGSSALFSNFQIHIRNILQSENIVCILQDFSKLKKENWNPAIRGLSKEAYDVYEFDTKALFYRPLSVILGYMMRLEKLSSDSHFGFISQSSFFADFFKRNNALWALAVSCETRIKVYAVGDGSRNKLIRGHTLDHIGLSCLVNCGRFITQALKHMKFFKGSRESTPPTIPSLFQGTRCDTISPKRCPEILPIIEHKEEETRSVFSENSAVTDGTLTTLLSLGRFEQAKQILLQERRLQSRNSPNSKEDQVSERLAHIYYYEATKTSDDKARKELYDKAVFTVLSSKEYHKSETNIDILFNVYTYEGHHDAALRCVEAYLATPDRERIYDPIIRVQQQRAVVNSMSAHNALEYFEKHLAKEKDISAQVAFKLGLAICKMKLGMGSEGQVELKNLVDYALQYGPPVIDKIRMLDFLHEIFIEQMWNKLWEDGYVTLQQAFIVLESKCQFIDRKQAAVPFTDPADALCLVQIATNRSSYSRKVCLIEKAIDIISSQAEECIKLYSDSIVVLVDALSEDVESFDFHHFSRLFHESPLCVQNNHELRFSLIEIFTNYLCYCVNNFISDKYSKIISDLMILLSEFPSILIHPWIVPHLYGTFSVFTHALYFPGPSNLYSLNTKSKHSKSELVLPFIPVLFYEIACARFFHYISYDVKHAAVVYWRSLFLACGICNEQRAIRCLMSVILVTLSVPLWLKLKNFCERYLFLAPRGSRFWNGIDLWLTHQHPVAICALVFWKALHSPKTNLNVQKECIRMICHTIIKNVFNAGLFETPVVNGFITIGNKKFS